MMVVQNTSRSNFAEQAPIQKAASPRFDRITFIPDHQQPNKLENEQSQQLYPYCKGCSLWQVDKFGRQEVIYELGANCWGTIALGEFSVSDVLAGL
jgi:hypothetical protein